MGPKLVNLSTHSEAGVHCESLCLKGICCSQSPSSVLFFEQRFFSSSALLVESVAVIDSPGFFMASSRGQVVSPAGSSMSALQSDEGVSAKLGMVVGSHYRGSEGELESCKGARLLQRHWGERPAAHLGFSGLELMV